MDFRLPQEAEAWFSNLRDQAPFRVKFDFYYMLLMLGLATGQTAEPAGPEFVSYFVDDYKYSHRLISGLLIIAELKRFGIAVTNKAEVRRVIGEIFDPHSATGLTDVGIRLLNSYVSGGFVHICQAREKPHHADEFLINYRELLAEAIESSETWVAERAG